MGGLTKEQMDSAQADKIKFQKELQLIAESANQIEHEEENYKQILQDKLSKIHQFLRKVHDTLSATHREPELEKILRDLDEIAINVGMIENGERVILA